MKALAAASIGIALMAGVAQPKNIRSLELYVADTEGGKAALFVSPSRETLLIDSGNPGGRDTDRIVAMLNDAGVTKIDYLVSTHYHIDHVGGMQELAKRIPIAHYLDHGPSVEPREQTPGFSAAYAELQAKAKHTVIKPGDRIPIAGIDVALRLARPRLTTCPCSGRRLAPSLKPRSSPGADQTTGRASCSKWQRTWLRCSSRSNAPRGA
jgi:competence protein ComEC